MKDIVFHCWDSKLQIQQVFLKAYMVKKSVFTLFVAWNLLDRNQSISSWFIFMALFWVFCGRYFVFPFHICFFNTTCLFQSAQTEQGDLLLFSIFPVFLCVYWTGWLGHLVLTLFFIWHLFYHVVSSNFIPLVITLLGFWNRVTKKSCAVDVLLDYFSLYLGSRSANFFLTWVMNF